MTSSRRRSGAAAPRASGQRPRLAHSLHEALLDLCAVATDSIRARPDDAAVHAARKACKRIRAALRLLRGSLGEAVYRRENRAIRDAARPLTAMRDVFILRRILRQLPHPPAALARDLEADYRRESARVMHHGVGTALGQLDKSRARLRDRPAAQPQIVSAAAGLRRAYRAGRRTFAKAHSRTDARLHEWRKQTRYLLDELDLLQQVFDVRFEKLRRRAREVAQLLGDDHDLAVLLARLQRDRTTGPAFAADIEERRRKLQHRAAHVGKRLYRRSVKQIKARVARRMAVSR